MGTARTRQFPGFNPADPNSCWAGFSREWESTRSQRGFLGKHREMSVFHGFFHGFSMDIKAEEGDGSTWKHRDIQRNFLGSALPHPMLPHPPRIPWKAPGNSHMESSKSTSPDQGSDFQGSDFQGSPGKDGFSWHWKIQSRSKSTGNCFREQQGAGSASSQNPKSRSSRKRAQLPRNSSSRIPTEFLIHNFPPNSSPTAPTKPHSRIFPAGVSWFGFSGNSTTDKERETLGTAGKPGWERKVPPCALPPESQPEKTAGTKGKPGKAEL